MEERLSFASYAKCLKAAMQDPYDNQTELTQLLLGFWAIPDEDREKYNVYDKKNEVINVDKVMASNLFNNKENVHKSIRNNCKKYFVKEEMKDGITGKIKEYFEKEVLPSISLLLLDDMIDSMKKIISSDTSISEAMKKRFLGMAGREDDPSGFLSFVLLYAITKDNTKGDTAGKQVKESEGKVPWDTNEQYYNTYVENLFLHKGEGSKTVRLQDLFVMPRYEEIQWNGKKTHGNSVLDYISKFSMCDIKEQRYQGEILFIEGDAGVGKTSLVCYLAFLYKERKEEWEWFFLNKMLLCVRLRDIIPEGMKFSSDTIVKDILKYLKINSMDEFKEIYKNPLIILDGFDELCMVEGISANSDYYIYQISKSFADYKVIITTRPQYLDVERLNMNRKHIVLQHFDASQRKKWVDNYRETGILEYEKEGIEYILNEKNEEIDSICDTPMVMYMIVAGGINEEAKHNEWVLYHQIFYKELSETEYNSMFYNCDGIYSHGIKKYQDWLYRLSTEISYRMFCSGNMKLFLTNQDIAEIVSEMKIGDIKLKEAVQRCYALCNYWKLNGKGAVEFHHNNIRDFFLCEKIFYELNAVYQECESYDMQKVINYITDKVYSLFRYTEISAKVVEFIYLRTKYNYEYDKMPDFPRKECEKKYLHHFFSDMLYYGGVSHYDRNSGEKIYDNMINVLTNTVRIFRAGLDPYLNFNGFLWFNNVDDINKSEILRYNFNKIFNPFFSYHGGKGLNERGYFVGLNLNNAYFANANLRKVNIRKANLRKADLSGADLSGADLSDAYLIKADLSGADLRSADLSGADLSGADLRSADLRGADLRDTNLRDVDLRSADLRGANLRNTILSNGYASYDQEEQISYLKKMRISGLRIN